VSTAVLVCGKICAGKTIYAKSLALQCNAVLLSCDEITLLFGQHLGERHDEIVEKTQKYLLEKAAELLAKSVNIILDWGFWTQVERNEATAFFTARGFECELHYVKVSDAVWCENLRRRNAAFTGADDDFYYIDEKTAANFGKIFEPPIDYDVLYERD